jgi:cystathionine gamma-synthase
MDPFSAWLTLRGMRSLSARLRVQCENARLVAAFLNNHIAVQTTHFPGLASHPGHAIAARQMSDFGGMLSFQVDGGKERAMSVAASTRIFRRATSLGGTESLIEHRASLEGNSGAVPENLLRLSIGLEDPDDLISDLSHALDT